VLAGRFVGFEDSYEGKDGVQYYVKVIDLRTGRHTVDTTTGRNNRYYNGGGSDFGLGHTSRIALTARGVVAWIAQERDDPQQPPYAELDVADGRHKRLLTTGRDLVPASVALSADGKTVSWRDAAGMQSKQVPSSD